MGSLPPWPRRDVAHRVGRPRRSGLGSAVRPKGVEARRPRPSAGGAPRRRRLPDVLSEIQACPESLGCGRRKGFTTVYYPSSSPCPHELVKSTYPSLVLVGPFVHQIPDLVS